MAQPGVYNIPNLRELRAANQQNPAPGGALPIPDPNNAATLGTLYPLAGAARHVFPNNRPRGAPRQAPLQGLDQTFDALITHFIQTRSMAVNLPNFPDDATPLIARGVAAGWDFEEMAQPNDVGNGARNELVNFGASLMGLDVNARATHMGYANAPMYEDLMVKIALIALKNYVGRRYTDKAEQIGWINLDILAGMSIKLLDISRRIAARLDALGGHAGAAVVGMGVLLTRLTEMVNKIGGLAANDQWQELAVDLNRLHTAWDDVEVRRLVGEDVEVDLDRQINLLQDMIYDGNPPYPNSQGARIPGAAWDENNPRGQDAANRGGGRRKSKKTKRKSKTRKAKKAGKKRKGGYKFTRAANSRRSLRMKTRKLKSLTQKSPKKKQKKKQKKKHNKKYNNKSKHHHKAKGREGKHKRGKRR